MSGKLGLILLEVPAADFLGTNSEVGRALFFWGVGCGWCTVCRHERERTARESRTVPYRGVTPCTSPHPHFLDRIFGRARRGGFWGGAAGGAAF
jgi:hypothetical protein